MKTMYHSRTCLEISALFAAWSWYNWETPDNNVLSHPLRAGIYSLGYWGVAKFVYDAIPESWQPLMPITLFGSTIYYLVKSHYRTPPSIEAAATGASSSRGNQTNMTKSNETNVSNTGDTTKPIANID